MGVVDSDVRIRLRLVADTAAVFVAAHRRRNENYDWVTPAEREALANLRTQIRELEREEQKAATVAR